MLQLSIESFWYRLWLNKSIDKEGGIKVVNFRKERTLYDETGYIAQLNISSIKRF